jgi:hypothetical protein
VYLLQLPLMLRVSKARVNLMREDEREVSTDTTNLLGCHGQVAIQDFKVALKPVDEVS